MYGKIPGVGNTSRRKLKTLDSNFTQSLYKLDNSETNKNRYDTILINEAYQKIMHKSGSNVNSERDSNKKDNFKSLTFKPN